MQAESRNRSRMSFFLLCTRTVSRWNVFSVRFRKTDLWIWRVRISVSVVFYSEPAATAAMVSWDFAAARFDIYFNGISHLPATISIILYNTYRRHEFAFLLIPPLSPCEMANPQYRNVYAWLLTPRATAAGATHIKLPQPRANTEVLNGGGVLYIYKWIK